MESNDDNRATCLGAPVLPESCGAGTNLAPMGESTVLHPAEHPLVHSTAFPPPKMLLLKTWKCGSVQDPARGVQGPSARRAPWTCCYPKATRFGVGTTCLLRKPRVPPSLPSAPQNAGNR